MASQQPPARPWFRLATMVRLPSPPTTPAPLTPQHDVAPQPRPAFIQSAFSTFRVPTSAPPPEPTPTPPPPPLPTAPPVKTLSPPPTPPSVAPPPPPPPITAPPSPVTAPPPPRSAPPVTTPSPPSTAVKPPPPSPRIVSAPPPSPITKVSAPSTPPLRNSPTPKLVSPFRVQTPTASAGPTTIIIRTATPISSSKIVKQSEKTPPPSPNIKPISHPPSPLTLPSPKLKFFNESKAQFEQKNVLVQETKEKPKASPPPKIFNKDLHRHIGEIGTHGPKREIITKESGTHYKKRSDSEDFGMRIITIAGENKGAIMELSPSHNKKHEFGNNPHSLHVEKGNSPTAWSDGEKSGSDGGNVIGEGRSKMKNKNQNTTTLLMTAVMNSNVQGMNNSLLYNCSSTHHDPGVHLSLSRKPNGGPGFHLKDRGNT